MDTKIKSRSIKVGEYDNGKVIIATSSPEYDDVDPREVWLKIFERKLKEEYRYYK